jgi:hypothetical protein
MSNVSPNPSDRELIQRVAEKKLAVEKAAELLRGNDRQGCNLLVLDLLNKHTLDVGQAAKLMARLDDLAKPKGRVYCKVSGKGGLSLYGLQRMPVTLYIEQWQRLLENADDIRAFMVEHDSELRRKGDPAPAMAIPVATAAAA